MKILVAVDRSDASDKAVRFVSTLLAHDPGQASIALFHVIESLPEFIVSRSDSGNDFQKVADEWNARNREQGEQLLAAHRDALTAAGIDPARVETKLAVEPALPEARKVVAAIEIIEEMKAGDYNVVALGRRAHSSAELPYLGTVASTVLREAQGKTVWVVD